MPPPFALAGGDDIDRKLPSAGMSAVVPELGSWGKPKVEENPPPWKTYPDDCPGLLVGERLRVLHKRGSLGYVRLKGDGRAPAVGGALVSG